MTAGTDVTPADGVPRASYCPNCNLRSPAGPAADGSHGSCVACGAALVPAGGPTGALTAAGGLDETQVLADAGGDTDWSDAHHDGGGLLSGNGAADGDDGPGGELHVYRMESLLGRGGMGRVYLARHRDLHRRCALKVLSPRVTRSDFDYVDRFQQEGRAAAALNHPNLVTLHAIGESRGFHFLEMEFVPGRSLSRILREEGPLPPAHAVSLATLLAEGLAHAHRRGVVHRDLKPDNVLVTLAGVPKIADFGLAKRVRGAAAGADHTLSGTPNYMAPELLLGGPASPAGDVYALGVTLFLLLTGRLPYRGATLGELREAVLHGPPADARAVNPHVPLEVGSVLSMLLDRAPQNRPVDATAALLLLGAVAARARDIGDLLGRAFRHTPGVSWVRDGERYDVTLELDGGRRQRVVVEPSDHAVAERLLKISSVCCPSDPAFFGEALRINARMPHGSLAVREVDGTPTFCVIDTYPRATADVEEVRRSVLEVARRADAVEKLLTGEDVN